MIYQDRLNYLLQRDNVQLPPYRVNYQKNYYRFV